jgi:hypothetical protein
LDHSYQAPSPIRSITTCPIHTGSVIPAITIATHPNALDPRQLPVCPTCVPATSFRKSPSLGFNIFRVPSNGTFRTGIALRCLTRGNPLKSFGFLSFRRDTFGSIPRTLGNTQQPHHRKIPTKFHPISRPLTL